MPEIACGRQCRVLPLAKIEKKRTARGVEWRLGHRDQFMVLIRSTGRPQKHQHYAGRAARLWPIASRLHGRPPAIRSDRVAGCRVTVPGTRAPPIPVAGNSQTIGGAGFDALAGFSSGGLFARVQGRGPKQLLTIHNPRQ